MSPAKAAQFNPADDLARAQRAILEVISAHDEWFVAESGVAPFEIRSSELEFYIAHSRLIFSCWTASGSRAWRITGWSWTGEKLALLATRRLGAEAATIELVPRASARALVASIAAVRQARCEKLARLVAQTLLSDTSAPPAKIERVVLSPGMRRDQPGRYARIILRLPHERVAVTATVARSDARNVDSLFSSALLWFNRLQSSPKRPSINRLLIVVKHNILEAARQRHVLLRDSLRQRIDLFEIDDEWQAVEPTRLWERKYAWRKRLSRFPPLNSNELSARAGEILEAVPM